MVGKMDRAVLVPSWREVSCISEIAPNYDSDVFVIPQYGVNLATPRLVRPQYIPHPVRKL
jgi:hypothetical protein